MKLCINCYYCKVHCQCNYPQWCKKVNYCCEKCEAADSRIAELEAQLTAAQAEITRLREGGCAREQATTQWCAEAQQLESRYRTLLVAIDECLSSNPQPLPRIVALLTDPLRNPSSGVMQVAKRGIAAELNVEDFDRDTARRMGLFDE